MMTDQPQAAGATPQRFGRTWADFFTSIGGVVVLILIVVAVGFLGWRYFEAVPLWVLVAFAMSFIWWPWLVARAKDDADLLLIYEGNSVLTEYRIGRRVAFEIEGAPVVLTSKTGGLRRLLTGFNLETMKGEGCALAEHTVFDYVRDLNTFDRLARSYSAHLKEERLTRELVGVEVQRKVAGLSGQWVDMVMGSVDPCDILEAIQGTQKEHIVDDLEEVFDDETPA